MMVSLRAGPPIFAELVRANDASVVTLTLGEPAAEQNLWRLRLIAELRDGTRGHVGQLLTRTQNASAGRPSRVIGVAMCPGAVAWHVEASLLGSGVARPHGELGAAVAPGSTERAEVIATAPNAQATTYGVFGGVGAPAPGTAHVVAAGTRVLAFSATRLAAALTNGVINVEGNDLQVPPGTSLTVEPAGALLGPVTITFTDCDAYVVEQEV